MVGYFRSYFRRRYTARIVHQIDNRPFEAMLYAQATGIWLLSMVITNTALFGVFGGLAWVLRATTGASPDLFERLMYYTFKAVVPAGMSLLMSTTLTLEWFTQLVVVHQRYQP